MLAPAEVLASIERLVSLKLVEWVAPKASSAPPETELVEDVEIDGVLQERIIQAFHRSDKLNHYELLGVAMDAERAEIRKAYFALSKEFHPDAYYGKRLGSFKPKMEVVFRKVTDAYEAVGRAKKREAYDRYLKQKHRRVCCREADGPRGRARAGHVQSADQGARCRTSGTTRGCDCGRERLAAECGSSESCAVGRAWNARVRSHATQA